MHRIISISLQGKEIYKGKLEKIPIKEEYIMNECIKRFMDNDPCIIHRSYVIKKFLLDFIEIIEKHDDAVCIGHLDKEIVSQFDIVDIEKATLTVID